MRNYQRSADAFGGETRRADGVTVTLVRDDEWKLVVAGRGEGPLEGMRQIAAICDRENWKIRCVSTPTSILRDMDGSRGGDQRAAHSIIAPTGDSFNLGILPEELLAGKIGRADLLESRQSRLRTSTDRLGNGRESFPKRGRRRS